MDAFKLKDKDTIRVKEAALREMAVVIFQKMGMDSPARNISKLKERKRGNAPIIFGHTKNLDQTKKPLMN